MKTAAAALVALSLIPWLKVAHSFVPVVPHQSAVSARSALRLYSTTEEKDTKEDKDTADKDAVKDATEVTLDSNADGLPWWWDMVWKLNIMKRGEPGEDIIFGDSAHVLRTNIEQIYGGYPSLDGCPLAEGDISDIADGTMFIGLQRYYEKYQSPYKLCFGPKSFLVISDPVQAKHILRDANTKYDKGVLAEILEPIMGKGLIPADPQTWSVRRRQIVPGFHKVCWWLILFLCVQ